MVPFYITKKENKWTFNDNRKWAGNGPKMPVKK